jgi:hypothetical protein
MLINEINIKKEEEEKEHRFYYHFKILMFDSNV